MCAAGHSGAGSDERRFIEASVGDPDQIRSAVNEAVERLGGVGILFNHAGTVIVKPSLLLQSSVMSATSRSVWFVNKSSVVLP